MKTKKKLGILGGMGPYAGVSFLRLVTEHTRAQSDADHLDIVMTSTASIHDRSAFLLNRGSPSPLPKIKRDIETLVFGGADIIAVPCNTACCFIEEISVFSAVPIIDIISETVLFAKSAGAKRLGILATAGTLASGKYQSACRALGIDPVTPSVGDEARLTDLIYRRLKAGAFKADEVDGIIGDMLCRCDFVVVGCTELSLIDISVKSFCDRIIDSSRVLALKAITECGAEPTGFEKIYEKYGR